MQQRKANAYPFDSERVRVLGEFRCVVVFIKNRHCRRAVAWKDDQKTLAQTLAQTAMQETVFLLDLYHIDLHRIANINAENIIGL